MRLSLVRRTLLVSIACLIPLDGALFLYVRHAMDHSGDDRRDMIRQSYRRGESVPSPRGLTSTNDLALASALPGVGFAVRFASRNCKYCQEDTLLWRELSAKLGQAHYDIITMVPTANDEYGPTKLVPLRSMELTYVDMGWLAHFNLHVTPILLIFDGDHKLLWAHQGTLSEDDIASATRAI